VDLLDDAIAREGRRERVMRLVAIGCFLFCAVILLVAAVLP
jgi:hypothetical protein